MLTHRSEIEKKPKQPYFTSSFHFRIFINWTWWSAAFRSTSLVEFYSNVVSITNFVRIAHRVHWLSDALKVVGKFLVSVETFSEYEDSNKRSEPLITFQLFWPVGNTNLVFICVLGLTRLTFEIIFCRFLPSVDLTIYIIDNESGRHVQWSSSRKVPGIDHRIWSHIHLASDDCLAKIRPSKWSFAPRLFKAP